MKRNDVFGSIDSWESIGSFAGFGDRLDRDWINDERSLGRRSCRRLACNALWKVAWDASLYNTFDPLRIGRGGVFVVAKGPLEVAVF
jgi:hypothetical protein